MNGARRSGWWVVAAVLGALLPAADGGSAQTVTLTVEEAVAEARRSNPAWLSARNDLGAAAWRERAAFGDLLPSATASLGVQYQAPGTPTFGLFTAEDIGVGKTPEYYFSDYRLGLNYQLSPATLFGIGEARANRRAVESQVNAAEFTLSQLVTQQYLVALRARDQLRSAQEAEKRAAENYQIAVARVEVGAASPLDSLQAAVELGRAQVEVLQAAAAEETTKLQLLEQVGVTRGDTLVLTSEFTVFEPTWEREVLVAQALSNNPTLRAARATADAATASVRMARSAYLPTLSVSAGWSGYTRQSGDPDQLVEQALGQAQSQVSGCERMNLISAGLSTPLPGYPVDCTKFVLSDAQLAAVRQRNDIFPFDFLEQPASLSLRVSVPIFQGFERERDVEAAQALQDDSKHQARATELRLRTQVASSLEALNSSYRSVGIEQRNVELARLRVELARERYRLGAAPFLDLQQAEADLAQAEQSLLDVAYQFHEALVGLEAAVGESLR